MQEIKQKAAEISVWKMYISALFALLGSFAMGNTVSYTGSALPYMTRNGSSVEHIMNVSEAKTWFTSIIAIGAVMGALVAGPLSNGFGRRYTIIALSFPYILGWLLIAFAKSFIPLLIGRWLTGVCAGMACTTCGVYSVEIATPNLRGFFGFIFGTFGTVGVLFVSIVSTFCGWELTAIVCATVPALCAIGMIFIAPESPKWLVGKGRLEAAKKAMEFLYGGSVNSHQEVAALAGELGKERMGRVKLSEYTAKSALKPTILVVLLMLFQQFSGFSSFLVYSVQIFTDAGAFSVPPLYCAIIIQCAQVTFSVIAANLVDRLGRRPLLLMSAAGLSIGMTILATYTYLDTVDTRSMDSYRWIPLACLFLFMATFESGFGPIPWLLVPELIPLRVRGTISGVATATMWMSFFTVSKTYDFAVNLLGKSGVYYAYALSNCLAFTFLWYCIPETKDRKRKENKTYVKEECEPDEKLLQEQAASV